MLRMSTTPIISTQNCNYSLRYCAATSLQRGPWVAAQKYDQYWRLQLQFSVLLMMGVIDTRNM